MSVYLVRRKISPDKQTGRDRFRWHVRAELPGSPIIHLGVYETKELANLRRDTALKEIAQGREPVRFAPVAESVEPSTTKTAAETWLTTLHDIADSTRSYYVRSAETLPVWLARMDPATITHTEIQAFVTELTKPPRSLKRGTISRELAVLRMILDNAGVRDNPVGDKRVRLPRRGPKRMRLPSKSDIALLHAALPTRVELLTLLEHTGMRISEAAALRWEDIDYERNRLLVAAGKTGAARRWVYHLPGTPEYPSYIAGVIPHTGLVFRSPGAQSLTSVLREVHIDSKGQVPLFSAHDFRHLHASRLLHNGILSPAQIAERLGHSNPGITLSTYSHVVPPE